MEGAQLLAVPRVLVSPLQQHSLGTSSSRDGAVAPDTFLDGSWVAGEWGQGTWVLSQLCFAPCPAVLPGGDPQMAEQQRPKQQGLGEQTWCWEMSEGLPQRCQGVVWDQGSPVRQWLPIVCA